LRKEADSIPLLGWWCRHGRRSVLANPDRSIEKVVGTLLGQSWFES
jgi:hypothetical protein